MKKLVLIASLTLVVASKNALKAQEIKPKISILKSDTYTLTSNGNSSTLEGNVAITADKLEIAKADKVIINKETNKIIVVGFKEFSFKGKLVAAEINGDKQQTLEYTVGEDVAYFK